MTYRIGTRGSALARAQTESVRARLAAAFPADTFEVAVISTRGDRVTDRPIAALGDNAPFTREIERALLDGRIDLAVHSMKDLPAACPDGLALARAWTRGDPRDAFLARDGATPLARLPPGATVASGSPRRSVLLRRMRPDLRVVGIRGNVDTRLRKLFAPEPGEPVLDGLILAVAGLRRLGREEAIVEILDTDAMIPAANQGQLAIEVRAGDTALRARLDALGSGADETVAEAERGFLREIGADCHAPVGAFAAVTDAGVRLKCVYARDETEPPVFADVTAPTPGEAAFRAACAVRRRLAGTVTLVGAGPGDPGLVTVKGLDALKSADAIVYDRLASDELLRFAKPGCRLRYVGKASGSHTLPQDEINALLVREAMAVRRVVRLKGGDPFVFGRGGEEMAYLLARGVPCTAVPGVTSAIAAPASVGIPVTHRGVARGFDVVTAHAAAGEPLDIDFTRLLDPKRTCVFLMGLKRIADLAAALVSAGRPAATPAAVVSRGTAPDARCVSGTLADIAAKTAAAGLVSPAVLVVGDVVRLRARLGFPLAGRTFLVPEIGGGRNRLAALLAACGADVTVREVGRIEAVPGALSAADLDGVTWLAFTSRNGLLPFDGALAAAVRRRGIRIAAIGRATAAAVAAHGLGADFTAAEATGAGLLGELAAKLAPQDVVLHPTAADAESALAGLSAVCAYRPAAVYRNVAVPLAEPVDLDAFDAAFFTCASSARRVYANARGAATALAIGPATRAALAGLGVGEIATAAEPSAEALVDLALGLFAGSARPAGSHCDIMCRTERT